MKKGGGRQALREGPAGKLLLPPGKRRCGQDKAVGSGEGRGQERPHPARPFFSLQFLPLPGFVSLLQLGETRPLVLSSQRALQGQGQVRPSSCLDS